MTATLRSAQQSDPVRSLDNVGPASDQIGPGQIKAGLRDGGQSFALTMRDAIIAHYGSVKEAAFALTEPGKSPLDPSLMMREFGDAKFGRFDALGDERAKAAVIDRLAEVFAVLTSATALAHRDLDEIVARVNRVRQALLFLDERAS